MSEQQDDIDGYESPISDGVEYYSGSDDDSELEL